MAKEIIYVIAPSNGPYKIGVTTRLEKRLYDLQISHWLELKVHKTYSFDAQYTSDHVYFQEKRIHAALKSYHIRGEWFDCSLKLIDDIITAILDIEPLQDTSHLPSITDINSVIS